MATNNGRKYWWVALLLTGLGILLGVGSGALTQTFSAGKVSATVQADIETLRDGNSRQDGELRDLAGTDKMLSDTVTELRVEQRGTVEQLKAVDARLSNIEKTQTEMSRKLDRLLERN